MQPQVTPLNGSKALGITFTDKPVTAFGGLARFVAIAQRIGLAAKLAEALPFVLTSPNATPPHHIVLAFLAGVLAGARRFAQLAVLPTDVPVRQRFGFHRFPPKAITATFEPLWRWCLDRLPARSTGYTLDLDSSVFERAGTQEGALKGYHPRKRGRVATTPSSPFWPRPGALPTSGSAAATPPRLAGRSPSLRRCWRSSGRTAASSTRQSSPPWRPLRSPTPVPPGSRVFCRPGWAASPSGPSPRAWR